MWHGGGACRHFGRIINADPAFFLSLSERRALETNAEEIGFALVFALVAVLYSSVGQVGGTGYVAVMALADLHPTVIKPTALLLNLLVAAIALARYARAGLLTWKTCYPFAILGAPFSVLGGVLNLSKEIYEPIVGVLLVAAAVQMFPTARAAAAEDRAADRDPPFLLALLTGGGIGFVSGITGIGGGIFLAPLVLSLRWVSTRRALAVSAAFNLLNSAAALAGAARTIPRLPAELPYWLVVVGLAGLYGSWLGVARLPASVSRYILAVLLASAGLRMLLATSD